jgi:PAS domain S-box-containing protein
VAFKLTIPRLRRQVLLRGESVIASVGILTGMILLTTMGVAAWWASRSQENSLAFARREQVRTIATILGRSAESMLEQDQLSALRRIIIEARQKYELTVCRITLPDGAVIADAQPRNIKLATLPRRWASGPIEALPESTRDDQITVGQPLTVPGRGSAMLRIDAPLSSGAAQLWEVQAGVGLIGAAGVAALLLVYRRVRRKVLTLGLIRESLLAIEAGETARDALTINVDHGPEARAWNHFLALAEDLRQQTATGRGLAAVVQRRESSGEIDQAYDALSVGLVIVDETGRIRQCNGAAAVMLRCDRKEMIGAGIEALLSDPRLREWLSAAIRGSAMERKSAEAEHGNPNGGGGVLKVRVRPLRREDAPGSLITIEDITQQRSADAARNAFIAQATHELRTPLTNMRLYLEEAIDSDQDDPVLLAKSLNVVNQETRRLERMVGEMLSVAEIEAGSLKIQRDDVRLDKLFEDLKAEFEPQAKAKKINLVFHLPPKLPVLQADRDKSVLMLHNLVGNALKYTPDGGQVKVRVNADAANLLVEVSDSGIGIREEEQERIFERFYRSKDPRVSAITGSGLGLALAREVARLHGGDVKVESQLEKGSTFTVMLPVTARAA